MNQNDGGVHRPRGRQNYVTTNCAIRMNTIEEEALSIECSVFGITAYGVLSVEYSVSIVE